MYPLREAFQKNKLKSLKVAQVKDEMDGDEDDGCDGVCDVVCDGSGKEEGFLAVWGFDDRQTKRHL